nr:UDP-glucuronic acid decarboxylase 1 [Polyrhizophydium stewartii]
MPSPRSRARGNYARLRTASGGGVGGSGPGGAARALETVRRCVSSPRAMRTAVLVTLVACVSLLLVFAGMQPDARVIAAPVAAADPKPAPPPQPVQPPGPGSRPQGNDQPPPRQPPSQPQQPQQPASPPKTLSKSPEDVAAVGLPEFGTRLPLSELRRLYIGPVSGKKLDEAGDMVTYDPSRKTYPAVRRLGMHEQKRILVTGGAGFVGSHLVDRLMKMGHLVTVVDNFFTGNKRNIEHWLGHPNFELVRHDVVDPFMMEVDQIYHLACPASPPHYQYNPIKTVKTSVMGTINMLGLAKRVKARFLLTSTSEVYGDPEVHPQSEDYWGHVNPIGPRACYDEGKRVAETLTYSYAQQDKVDVRVVRIFNTFGPRMNPEDGRVVSNFIMQALKGENLTIYGDGTQTRSFQYVHDLVDGLIQTMNSNYSQPVNLGNPDEYTIGQFATLIRDLINKNARIVNLPATKDDPQKRRPDITRARTHVKWEPRFSVHQGIQETIEYFKSMMDVHDI